MNYTTCYNEIPCGYKNGIICLYLLYIIYLNIISCIIYVKRKIIKYE